MAQPPTARETTGAFRRAFAFAGLLAALALGPGARAFQPRLPGSPRRAGVVVRGHPGGHPAVSPAVDDAAAAPPGFIDGELRGAAMRLHTRAQAPKEGKAKASKGPAMAPGGQLPTTLEDYARFLADSREVYAAFEDATAGLDALAALRDTGLERTAALTADLAFLAEARGAEAGVLAPGPAGTAYAAEVRRLTEAGAVPELVCHYYNHYFAHTAGGLMLGKMLSKQLLDGRTLAFHQWPAATGEEGARSARKPAHLLDPVRDEIERLAAAWSEEERARCVGETAATFKYGGSLNAVLLGGQGASH